jgi:hypothetical protein
MSIYFQKNNKIQSSIRNNSPTNISNTSNTTSTFTVIESIFGRDNYLLTNLQFAGIFSNGRKQYKRVSVPNHN